MTIIVTQEHIDNGVKGSCYRCPIALAMVTAGLVDVLVADWSVKVSSKWINIPRKVINWIVRFDYTGYGEPFSFELGIPA